MFKVGQRVKIREDRYDLGPGGIWNAETWVLDDIVGGQARLTLPAFGQWFIPLDAIRSLKKKKMLLNAEVKYAFAKPIPPPTLKGEIAWMNKIQKNFYSDEYRHPIPPRRNPIFEDNFVAIRRAQVIDQPDGFVMQPDGHWQGQQMQAAQGNVQQGLQNAQQALANQQGMANQQGGLAELVEAARIRQQEMAAEARHFQEELAQADREQFEAEIDMADRDIPDDDFR